MGEKKHQVLLSAGYILVDDTCACELFHYLTISQSDDRACQYKPFVCTSRVIYQRAYFHWSARYSYKSMFDSLTLLTWMYVHGLCSTKQNDRSQTADEWTDAQRAASRTSYTSLIAVMTIAQWSGTYVSQGWLLSPGGWWLMASGGDRRRPRRSVPRFAPHRILHFPN